MKSLVALLAVGNEHVRELESQLHLPCSAQACKLLAREAQSALAKAIAMAKLYERGIPPSSDKAFKVLERREMRKRDYLRRSFGRVIPCPEWTMKATVNDGHSWRKYGQKVILGAKFPRGYYRCAYRNSHGCLATKKVQRSEHDTSFFDITYSGVHTCNHGQKSNPVSHPAEQTFQRSQTPMLHSQQPQLLEICRSGLAVKTEGLGLDEHSLECSPNSSFPSTPASCMKAENEIFSGKSAQENPFAGNYMPIFLSASPSTQTNYSVSANGMNDYWGGEIHRDMDLEIEEMISSAAGTTNSQIVGMDFDLEEIGLDSEFILDLS
ncbi:hypothetical protein HPP92_005208 [Vanilla planifolia]|uniref:WRKY domain-containing protein n=1 Tax=Vanilla planifolia TaxID=51239 RepID=A0A835RGD4_VANPL|nr:hypothetical protein HPP92_005208 [Vanilla planifolia]